MKKLIRYFVLLLTTLSTACFLQSCPGSKSNEFYSLAGATKGKWQWVQTSTPTRIITPQTLGYTQQMAVLGDNAGPYIAFYRNDTLRRRENETGRDTTHTFVDEDKRTVLIKYGGAGYIKYTISKGNNNSTITISEFLPSPYALDSVRMMYKNAPLDLYPY